MVWTDAHAVYHQLAALLHLPCATQGRQATNQDQLHTLLNDILLELVFFSPFESLDLHNYGPMEQVGMEKLYEPSQCLFSSWHPARTCLGKDFYFPYFWTATWHHHSFLVPSAPAHQIPTWHHKLVNALNATGRKGSNVYEMNLWVWQFGRGNPQLGGLSVADKEDRWTELLKDGHRCAVETRKRPRRVRLQSDMALKKAACANISHVYPIFICLEQR